MKLRHRSSIPEVNSRYQSARVQIEAGGGGDYFLTWPPISAFHLPMIRSLTRSRLRLPKPPLSNLRPRVIRQPFCRSIMAETLPPLSRQERETYGKMGTTMELFHNSFRQTWTLLYSACSSGQRPAGMSIRQFLNTAAEFCHHLDMHHSIGSYPLTCSLKVPCTNTIFRRTAHLSGPRTKNASVQERIGALDAA